MNPPRSALLAMLALGGVLAAGVACADRLTIWRIVHDQCAPHTQALPAPCVQVGATDAIIKDRVGVAQLLDIPTTRVTGVEDAQLLQADAPNYFANAWAARGLMRRYLASAPERDGLAITVNSTVARSQDQLHLHIDCLSAEVAKTLAAYAASIDGTWRPMTEALNGRKYWARRVESSDLVGADPFHLLADEMPNAKTEMGLWSLAAVPAPGGAGFLLLADHAELTQGGHAEDLQDHDCAIAR